MANAEHPNTMAIDQVVANSVLTIGLGQDWNQKQLSHINELDERLADEDVKNDELREQIGILESEIEAANVTIEELQANEESLTEQVGVLRADNNAKDHEITILKMEKQELETEMYDARYEAACFKTRLTRLEEELKVLRAGHSIKRES